MEQVNYLNGNKNSASADVENGYFILQDLL